MTAIPKTEPSSLYKKPTVCCPYLERILDKKVNDTALNCFEKFIHWLFNLCSSCYRNLYEFKRVVEPTLNRAAKTFNLDPSTASVHRFADKTLLFDFTKAQKAGARGEEVVFGGRLINSMGGNGLGHIFFAKKHFTDYVLLRDHPNEPSKILLCEQEFRRPDAVQTEPRRNVFTVDTSQVYKIQINPFQVAEAHLITDPAIHVAPNQIIQAPWDNQVQDLALSLAPLVPVT